MYKYECKRCFHKTKQKVEMFRHLNRQNICNRINESYKYPEDMLYKLSITKIHEKNIINKNLECNYCNRFFSRKFSLDRHKDICKVYNTYEVKFKKYIDYLLNYIDNIKDYNKYPIEVRILIKISHIHRIKKILSIVKPDLFNVLEDEIDEFINIDFTPILNSYPAHFFN